MEKLFDKFLLWLTKWVLYFAIWAIYLTCKKTYTPTNLPKNPCIVVFWHGRIAMMSFAYKRYWVKTFKGKRQGKVIISDHKDGEIITQVVSKFGIEAVRGSSRKGAARALINAFKEIRDGNDIIITPDGPRGPLHSVADGAVVIAQKMSLDICVGNYEASRYWKLKSWDEMIIPKPFSKINYSLSLPFSIEDMKMEVAKEKIKNELFKARELDSKF